MTWLDRTQIETSRRQRRGVEVLELILTLPILFLTLIAGVQFSSVMSVDATLCQTALEVSRLAAMECDADQLSNRESEFLAIHTMAIGPGVRIVVEDETGEIHSFGDTTLSSPTVGAPVAANCVRTTLLADTSSSPLPNLLRDFCVNYDGKQFEHTAFALKQSCDCP